MRPIKCATCGQEPVISRGDDVSSVEIHCGCGAFLWVPSEPGIPDDRPIDEIEADAISLWNTAQGAKTDRV